MAWSTERSLTFEARMAGLCYLLTASTSVIGGLWVPGKLVVPGNAAATAENILAHRAFFQLGFAAVFLAVACSVAMTFLLYDLLKPVDERISLLAAFFHIVGLPILALCGLLQLAALAVLGRGGQFLSGLGAEQMQAFACTLLQLTGQPWNAFLVFFGFYCVFIGYLIFRSTFLPPIIGVLMSLAGVGYLTFLYPPLANSLNPYNIAPAALGETSLMFWLIGKGVNVERWKVRAG